MPIRPRAVSGLGLLLELAPRLERAFLGRSCPDDGPLVMEVPRREKPSQDGRRTITSAPVTKLLKGRKSLGLPNWRHHQSQ